MSEINDMIASYKEASNFVLQLNQDLEAIEGTTEAGVAAGWNALNNLDEQYSDLITGPNDAAYEKIGKATGDAETYLKTVTIYYTDDATGGPDVILYGPNQNSDNTQENMYDLLTGVQQGDYMTPDAGYYMHFDYASLKEWASEGKITIAGGNTSALNGDIQA